MKKTSAGRGLEGRTLVEFVAAMRPSALARMWVDFNRRMWPSDLPVRFKPHWWDGADYLLARSLNDRKHGFSAPFMRHAEQRAADATIGKAWKQATARPTPAKPKSKSQRPL